MAGKTLDLRDIIVEDQLGRYVANKWIEWNTFRKPWLSEKEEIRRYVFATDTTKTTNSQLPWKNKTTIPKLCQIRDNLNAQYMATIFPPGKKRYVYWEAEDRDSNTEQKRKAIEAYMCSTMMHPRFKTEIQKLILDYIDYGNCFVMADWIDERVEQKDKTQVGYVGPTPRRISPLDIVFNPVAPSFEESPKIIRSLVSLGEVKEILERMTTDENRPAMEELYDYMIQLRQTVRGHGGDLKEQDASYAVDGFTSFQRYLNADYVELLTFYGDYFDIETQKFHKNHVVIVADRHKVLSVAPNKSYFGYPPIFHCGWRVRQDNLWAMGPLDNLVGMQYRIDHLENLKADCFDLIAFPPVKVKGYVQDFTWGPMQKIYVGDDGSDVEIMEVPFQVLQTNSEIETLQNAMEEMSGSPKQALGFRTPGEKTAYEVQKLENAASRIFISKSVQFEEMEERLLNAMLEMGRRNITGTQDLKIYDEDYNMTTFMDLEPVDLVGAGRIRPKAARHFAEKAERLQNINNFFGSTLGQDQDIKAHFSSIKLAKLFEDLLDIEEYELVTPYIRLAEQKEAQTFANAAIEQVLMEAETPAGLTPDDYDQPAVSSAGAPPGAPPPGAAPPGADPVTPQPAFGLRRPPPPIATPSGMLATQ